MLSTLNKRKKEKKKKKKKKEKKKLKATIIQFSEPLLVSID